MTNAARMFILLQIKTSEPLKLSFNILAKYCTTPIQYKMT